MVDELRELITGRDLPQLINSVTIPALSLAYTDGQSLADGDMTASWAAKVEYLVGIALSVESNGDAPTPQGVTRQITQLISDIFAADQIRVFLDSLDRSQDGEEQLELLLMQLRLEYQADRMLGYPVHLEQIDAEVFDGRRNYYIDGLGFNPADVIRATRLRSQWVNQRFSSALSAVVDALNNGSSDPAVSDSIRQGMNAPTLWEPDQVSSCTGIPAEQISAMLEFFSTEFGCQPEFREPRDVNRARTHPCIKLEAGRYLVPDPWSMSAVLHQRLATEPKSSGYDPAKYFKHRQDAHQRLVTAAFKKVFEPAAVHPTQHYSLASGEKGEIDVLVSTEWPLVVEAKAITLTAPGRRGAPDRVEKKLEEILGKSLDQTNRALKYILEEEGRLFASREGGRQVRLLPEEVAGGTAIIATFERIDPFASTGLAAIGEGNRAAWIVSLTDLLMVTDILSEPAAFHHYARIRAAMHPNRATVFAEADALGAYLSNRLHILDQSFPEETAHIVIGYSCAMLNEFYTQRELGREAKKPSVDLPDDINHALVTALQQPGWSECVDAVMTAELSRWKKWKQFRRKHRRGGIFRLSEKVSLVAVLSGESTIERDDAGIKLTTATRR